MLISLLLFINGGRPDLCGQGLFRGCDAPPRRLGDHGKDHISKLHRCWRVFLRMLDVIYLPAGRHTSVREHYDLLNPPILTRFDVIEHDTFKHLYARCTKVV